jgi:tetratricopeptide (TPR) repeat protein
MSPHLARAEVLLSQGRPADAEREVRLALSENPVEPAGLTALARALLGQHRPKDALDPARAAVAAAPESPFAHYVLSHVWLQLDREDDALAAADRSLRLAPDDDDLLAHRAAVQLALRRWPAALADAEAALRRNAENTYAQNLRATALRQLGRADEAAEAGARTLARDPEDALSHASQGWTLLHRGDPRGAQTHFREALRLAPQLELAREGMLQAIKARNPIYRALLAYFLWMGRQGRAVQWVFVLVTLFVPGLIRSAVATQPSLGIVLWPLLVAFYLFVYLSWTAAPLSNLILHLHPFGRLVLDRQERVASWLYGGSLLLVFAAAGAWLSGGGPRALTALILTAMLSICVAAAASRSRPRSRLLLAAATAALAAVAVAVVTVAPQLFTLFLISFLGFQFLANALRA